MRFMNNIQKKIIYPFFIAALFLVACGSDSGMSTGEGDEVKTIYSLGACKDANEGITKLVTSENRKYKCVNGDWEAAEAHVQPSSSSEGSPNGSSDGNDLFVDTTVAVYETMTDERDGRTYKTVKIGKQVWMAENLNYRYLGPTADLDSSSFCFDDDLVNCDTYGRLYLWSAAMDSAGIIEGNTVNGCGKSVDSFCDHSESMRGVCPQSWHLPKADEWAELIATVGCMEHRKSQHCQDSLMSALFSEGQASTAGAKLKYTSGWNGNGNGVDAFGFSALPAGFWFNGSYGMKGDQAYFWSSNQRHNGLAYYINLINANDYASLPYYDMGYGYSVRCLKD